MWTELGMTLLMMLLAYLLYRQIKHQPDAFSAANMSRSASVLGILALLLIAFLALCVVLLRQGG